MSDDIGIEVWGGYSTVTGERRVGIEDENYQVIFTPEQARIVARRLMECADVADKAVLPETLAH